MATSWREQLRSEMERTANWINDRNSQLQREGDGLLDQGREAWVQASRAGHDIAGRTADELRNLARDTQARVAGRGATSHRVAQNGSTPTPRGASGSPMQRPIQDKGALQQARAALSGFADEGTFGLADRVLAAADAVGDGYRSGSPTDLLSDYQRHMADKRANDAYDDAHYGLARGAGRVAGLAAGVAATGAPGVLRGAAALLPRGAEVVRILTTSKHALDPRGLNTMAAVGGGAAGIVGQGLSDVGSGHLSGWGDYVGAATGGAVDGLATLHGGPVVGGGAGGAIGSAAQDVLSGRPVSVDRIVDSAHLGSVVGGAAGLGGGLGAQRLSSAAKGKVGETLSQMKTFARGDGVPFGLGRHLNLDGGGHTFTDLQFHPRGQPADAIGIGEAKMGPSADLTRRQRQARRQFGDRYVVDGWRFSDVGKIAGSGASSALYGLGSRPWDDLTPPTP